jgi:hypothetical protein
MAMDAIALRGFLLWCTIINVALLLIAVVFMALAGDLVHRIQSRMYAVPRAESDRIMYMFLGFYKILILVFNLVPYLALRLLG